MITSMLMKTMTMMSPSRSRCAWTAAKRVQTTRSAALCVEANWSLWMLPTCPTPPSRRHSRHPPKPSWRAAWYVLERGKESRLHSCFFVQAAEAGFASLKAARELPPIVLPAVAKHDATDDEVFVIDLGSDTVKYGWSSDLEPRCVLNTALTDDLRPLGPVVNARDRDYVSRGGAHVAALVKLVLKLGAYRPKNALLLCSGLPTLCDANEDLLDGVLEPAFTDVYVGREKKAFPADMLTRLPQSVFFGSSAVLAACGALVSRLEPRGFFFSLSHPSRQRTVTPTAFVVDLGHNQISCVPVCGGVSIHHAGACGQVSLCSTPSTDAGTSGALQLWRQQLDRASGQHVQHRGAFWFGAILCTQGKALESVCVGGGFSIFPLCRRCWPLAAR